MIDEDLFIDEERMRGGMLFNPALANALCKSVCMIAVYTPTYFSSRHTYCAREFRAMEMLEEVRLARLRGQHRRESGFIIPIILRGQECLPEAIRSHRHYYTFERFTLASRSIARSQEFVGYVREIASVIRERRELLAPLADELTCECQSFTFPTEQEILPWLNTIIAPANAFPLR